MTDDRWGTDEGDPFDDLDDEFGAVRFADDAAPGADNTGPDGTTAATSGLSFGANDTGDLPHWTEPPSRENPRTPASRGDDVWGGFGDDEDDPFLGEEFPPARQPRSRAGEGRDNTGETSGMRTPPRRGIGGGLGGRGTAPRGERPGNQPLRTPRGPSGGRQRAQAEEALNAPMDRDMPTAVGVGLGLAALFVLLNVLGRSWMVVILVCAIMAVGATEFFSKTSERGYHPVTAVGITAIALGPIAAYNMGDTGVVLTMTFAFVASALVFIASPGIQSGPLPNMAMTNLGVMYLGLLGSFGGLVLSGGGQYGDAGTDTMFLLVVGVVAADVGALFIGKAVGRTPLRGWISPGKTLEGFLGGLVCSIVAVSIFAVKNGTWNGKGNVLLFGLGVGLLAPIGDLTESMFKRNLDIKDFGTIIKGHGGVLDRFDGFLFALPFAYYALITLQPWTH